METQVTISRNTKKIVFFISLILLVIGGCGAPLLSRLYFLHGGSRVWLSTWLQSCGCPIMLVPLGISYFKRRKAEGPNARLTFMRFGALVIAAAIGLSSGLSAFFYSFGIQKLPVSTSTILSATTLVFVAVFAFFIVKQKFTAYSVNAIVLLMLGAVLLGLRASGDKPEGESKRMYILGFILTLASSALTGLGFPVLEWMYRKTEQAINFTFLMEVQFVVALFGASFASVAMLIKKDFQAIRGEAREFQLGEAKYYLILVLTGIAWQCFNLGLFGLLFSTSALVAGIAYSGLVPIIEVLSVIVYHEKFQAEKCISLVLYLWGLASHFYGEYKNEKKIQTKESEVVTTISPNAMITTILASSDV